MIFGIGVLAKVFIITIKQHSEALRAGGGK